MEAEERNEIPSLGFGASPAKPEGGDSHGQEAAADAVMDALKGGNRKAFLRAMRNLMELMDG